MKKVNIITIAEKAGVSIATVSRAFDENSSIKETTKKKIIDIANKLNFRPNQIARGLSTKRTDTIGLILPELSGEFFMEIIHSVDIEAHKANKYLIVASSFSERNTTETILEFMSSGRVDGMILMLPELNENILNLSVLKNKPVVFLNSSKANKNAVNFSVDNYNGAKLAVKHLISHGYKKIAFLGGPVLNCESIERKNGYINALKSHSLIIDKKFILNGDFTAVSGYNELLNLHKKNMLPNAVFAANDMMAVGIYEAAKEIGLSIPNDLAVVGFDNIYLSNTLQPKLTTVNVPISEIANKAVKYLLNMIKKSNDIKKNYSEMINPNLVIRESCGCIK